MLRGDQPVNVTAAQLSYEAAGGKCAYGCSAGSCAIEEGPDPAAEAAVRQWSLCGGSRRWCWPRGVALGDQQAAVVAQFETIDRWMAEAQKRTGG
jgi:hypothetical protein